MDGSIYIDDAINWDNSLNRGLISRWMALPDQQRGVMFRDLCKRNPGTLTNGPLWRGPMGRKGGFGSLEFNNAAGNYVAFDQAIVPTMGSVSCWVYIQDTSSAIVYSGVDVYNSGFWHWAIFTFAGTLYLQASSGVINYITEAAVTDTWIHYAIVRDGATFYGYKNGVQLGSAATGTNGNLGVLMAKAGATYYKGGLDDVAIWNRALSASEVQALYRDSMGEYATLNKIWRPRGVEAAAATGNRAVFDHHYRMLRSVA